MSESLAGRLFLGVALPDGAREALRAHLGAALGGEPLPGRPVPPRNWHLTLRFLGDADDAAARRLLDTLRAAPSVPAFSLAFGAPGAFPKPRRAAVLWLGVDEGAAELSALAGAAEAAARAAGFPPETRPYRPHLTLARLDPPRDVSALLARVPPARVETAVRAATLFRSRLGGGPARYEALARVPLG